MRAKPARDYRLLWAAIVLIGLCACGRHAGRPAATGSASANTPLASRSSEGAPATPAAGGYVIANPAFQALPGARALYGELAGAAYEIEIPGNWNGELVLYEHGFTGNDPVLFVEPPPIRAHIVQSGFAWAASSFSQSGYVPDVGLHDSLALLSYFDSTVAVPARTFIYGTSMGGHIVVSAMEQDPQLFAGALSECGVVMGEDEIDYVLSYVLAAQYFTGIQLYPLNDVGAYEQLVHSQVLPALGPANSPSLAGAQLEDLIANLTGGPRPFRHQGYVDRRTGTFDLAASEDPSAPSLGFLAATNATTRYHLNSGLGIDDATLNGQIVRVTGLPQARDPVLHPDFAPRTGQLQAPLLTLHTTGDHYVPISQEVDYLHTVQAAGAGQFLVQRAIRRPDHCQFTDVERQTAFDDLIKWVEAGVKPAGDDFSSGDLSNVGLQFTQPLLPGDPGVE